MPCDDSTAFSVKPIKFWSHEKWDLDTPCVNEGYAHTQHISLGRWAMRRVKDVFDDFYLAGRRTSCSECKKRKAGLKEELADLEVELSQEIGEAAAEEALGGGTDVELDEDAAELQTQILELRSKVKAFRYTSSTLNAHVNAFVFEHHPGIAVAFPAILTHKAAISIEALMVITRAARTAQSSHDLEAMFHEYKSLGNARHRLSFYQLQRLAGVSAAEVAHYDVGISSLSDNYISEVLNTFHETHLSYILQWSEQNIILDTAAGDHHGKRWARTQFEGAELLKWRWTVFNSAGQSAVVANTESCSMYDTALLAAHRRYRRAAAYWKHPLPLVATCDNPAKDGMGLKAAIWAGDGQPEFLYPGKTELVETEEQCDAACAYLGQFTELGFDAENVAYQDGSGVTSPKAAIVQLVGNEIKGYIFEVHKWPSLFASFKQLMGNRRIKKVSFGVGGDVGRVVKRFDLDALAVVGGVELAHEMAHLNLTKGSLADRVSAVFGEYLDKGIDHRCWEAPVKSERQIEYAITDAWAHLRLKQEAAKLTAAELAARTASPAGAGRLDPIDEEGRDEEEGGDDEEEEGGEEEEEDGESDDEMIDPPDEEAPARAATTRRHRRRPVPPGRRARRGGVQIVGGAASGGSHEPAVMMQVDAATGAPAGPDDGSEEPDEPVADEEDEAKRCRSAGVCRRLSTAGGEAADPGVRCIEPQL